MVLVAILLDIRELIGEEHPRTHHHRKVLNVIVAIGKGRLGSGVGGVLAVTHDLFHTLNLQEPTPKVKPSGCGESHTPS